ncbi:MAG TPA: hypothetical protein VFP20_07120 [Bacteroidales bacterium]|nr:hypothetical protein [Bacteroidales bacterium]
MKRIEATFTRSKDGFFNVHCNNEMFSGGGDTLEAAKDNMLEQMLFYKQTAIEDHFDYPNFLDNEFEIIYKLDTASFLEYYSGILSLSGLEKLTGIHQKQLWNYLHHKSVPRRKQVERIEQALHRFGSELQSISL